MKPFGEMHPVRGNFGDPRTLFFDAAGVLALVDPGAFSFHDGVAISSHPRTPVYPVASGLAHVKSPAGVEVRTPDDRRFVYKRIRAEAALRPGTEGALCDALNARARDWRSMTRAGCRSGRRFRVLTLATLSRAASGINAPHLTFGEECFARVQN